MELGNSHAALGVCGLMVKAGGVRVTMRLVLALESEVRWVSYIYSVHV